MDLGTPGRDDLDDIVARAVENGARQLHVLAGELGVTVESLRRLEVGRGQSAWSFPMKDANLRISGIRLRFDDGSKKSVRGSRAGLFIPDSLPEAYEPPAPLLIVEGPSDVAAALSLGFAAIGRPSCNGGNILTCNLVRRWGIPRVVAVADADQPGRAGALSLLKSLVLYCKTVSVIEPPAEGMDLRDWVRSGATKENILKAILRAEDHGGQAP